MKASSYFSAVITGFLFALLVFGLAIQIPTASAATRSTTLQGTLAFPTQDRDLPLRHSYFEVWKKCGLFDILTCLVTNGTTNLDGSFIVGFNEGCTCWIRAYTTIPNVVNMRCPEVHESSSNCQPPFGQSRDLHHDFQPFQIKREDIFNSVKLVLPPSTPMAESASVANTILSGWLFVKDQTGFSIPEVSVEFPCGTLCTSGVYFDPHTAGDIYIKQGLDAKALIHGYRDFLLWYHTTALSEDELSSLLEKSVTQNDNDEGYLIL